MKFIWIWIRGKQSIACKTAEPTTCWVFVWLWPSLCMYVKIFFQYFLAAYTIRTIGPICRRILAAALLQHTIRTLTPCRNFYKVISCNEYVCIYYHIFNIFKHKMLAANACISFFEMLQPTYLHSSICLWNTFFKLHINWLIKWCSVCHPPCN